MRNPETGSRDLSTSLDMTGKLAWAVLLLFAITASAQAEWKIVSAESEPGRAGIEHRHVVVEDAAAGQRVAVDVAVFSAKSTALRVIDNPDGQSLGAVMKREKCVCGVNGGYFDTEFKPIGLRVADGTTFSPLRRARLITGILLQSDRGIDVVRVSEFSRTKKIIAAIQSGPFLVEGNKRIRGLNDSQMARRTFAGIATNDRAFLGVCSDVSLAELANIVATSAHRCGFENPTRNESRRWFLERVLVRTRGRQRILNLRTKAGARFCGRRSEMIVACHPERSEGSLIVHHDYHQTTSRDVSLRST